MHQAIKTAPSPPHLQGPGALMVCYHLLEPKPHRTFITGDNAQTHHHRAGCPPRFPEVPRCVLGTHSICQMMLKHGSCIRRCPVPPDSTRSLWGFLLPPPNKYLAQPSTVAMETSLAVTNPTCFSKSSSFNTRKPK